MTILHPTELRDMTPAERQAELEDLETELLNAQAVKAAGGMPENPGRIKEMRRTIARVKTIQREEGDLDEEIDTDEVAETETTVGGLFGGSSDETEPEPEPDADDSGGDGATDDDTATAEGA